MIITISGPNGAGKSTCMRGVMRVIGSFKERLNDKGKIEAYVSRTKRYGSIAVIGRYTTPTGGCDTIQTKAEVQERVTRYAKSCDHVLFEGVIVSTSFGPYAEFLANLKEDLSDHPEYVFAILLPSLEQCVENVQKRRAARGDKKPLNTERVVTYHAYIKRVIGKCKQQEIPFVRLRYENKIEQIVELLQEASK